MNNEKLLALARKAELSFNIGSRSFPVWIQLGLMPSGLEFLRWTDTDSWSVLADWHEDHGDDEKATKCRCVSKRLVAAIENGTIVQAGSSTPDRAKLAGQDET